MAGLAENLTSRQVQAIAALLASPSIGQAASAVGVGERTLFRWLQDSDFQAAYRAARADALTQATARLTQAAGEAIDTLREVMGDTEAPASARVSAARTVLELAVRAVELEDLVQRVEVLEALQA